MNVLAQPYSPKEDLESKTKQLSASEAVGVFGGLELISYYFALLQEFYEAVGFKKEDTRFREASASDRAFYTASAFDFEVRTSIGWLELVACNYRTDYDLSGHSKMSKKELTVMDGEEKVLPHVVELSLGVDRSIFALMDSYFYHEPNREVLRLPANVAPYLAAVFPLISKPEFENKATEIYERLKQEEFATFYDDSGAIGRRYRRMDEIGTPFCITVDHETLQNDTVTIRERDSMGQRRVSSKELPETTEQST